MKKEIKATGLISGATLISRILGFIRDMALAYFLGATHVADAFLVAFRIPNFLRRLFAEGALLSSFLPVYTEYLETRPKEESYNLAMTTAVSLGILLSLLVVLGEIFAKPIISVIAWGFSDNPEQLSLTISLHRIMFPYIFFISLTALAAGILNSFRHFFAPAITPTILNLSIIACAIIAAYSPSPAPILAWGVFLGGLLQLLFQLPFLRKQGFFRGLPSINLRHPGFRKVLLLMGPAALGAAVYQINILTSTFLASFLPEGSISYLYYADRLMNFPLGVFAIALSTAVFPSLSAHSAKNDIKEFKATFESSLSLIAFISLPAAIGLIILGKSIVGLLFQRGSFGIKATVGTYQALILYAIGLPSISAIQIVVRAYYAKQDTKTPVLVGSICLLINIIISVILMIPFKHKGLALATTITATIQLTLLLKLLAKKIDGIDYSGLLNSFKRLLISSIGMALVLVIIKKILYFFHISSLIFHVSSGLFIGISVYFLFAKLLGTRELYMIMEIIFQKKQVRR